MPPSLFQKAGVESRSYLAGGAMTCPYRDEHTKCCMNILIDVRRETRHNIPAFATSANLRKASFMLSATAARFSAVRRSGGSNSRTELSSTKDSSVKFTIRISPFSCGVINVANRDKVHQTVSKMDEEDTWDLK